MLWALNKNPADRPADADQFITALEQAKVAILSGARRRADREHGGAGRRSAAGRLPAAAAADGARADGAAALGAGEQRLARRGRRPVAEHEPHRGRRRDLAVGRGC